MSLEKKISSYLNFLPAIYQRDAVITNSLLLACERMLSGIADIPQDSWGIEKILENIHRYFDPETTPQSFLEWLAGWMSLDLIKGKDWDDPDSAGPDKAHQHLPAEGNNKIVSRNRMLIRKLIPLFNIRGTRKGFEEILKVYLEYMDCTFIINELLNPFQIGGLGSAPSDRARLIRNHATNQKNAQPVNDVTLRELINLGNNGHLTSVIGSSSVVGEGMPYYFRVTIDTIMPVRPTDLQKKKKMIMQIIDKEKPAHTFYSIRISAPGMQIGEIDVVDGKHVRKYHCTIGEDTLIGGLTM